MDQLRPHQIKAAAELGNGKILTGGVGSGKSWVAMEYYMKNEAPKDVYVITTAKKRDSLDWVGEAARYGIGRSQDATVAGVLTVDSWNNIGNYTSVHGAFFIFDEQRLVGSGKWSKAFIHIARSNHWILLSATPGDNWLDYIPVFIANGFYHNRSQFKREHVVYNTYSKFPKVDHYIGLNKLVKLRNSILVEMPMERHTTRNTSIITVGYDRELFERVMKQRWHVYENRPLKDVAELFSVMRKVVNSDASRLATVRELMKIHPKLIVFYNFDYELEILRTLGVTATSPDSQPQPSINMPRMKADKWNTGQTVIPSSSSKSKSEPSPSSNETATTVTQDSGMGLTRNHDRLATTVSASDVTSDSVIVAEWNGHKHEKIPDGDNWVYLVQYTAGSEGWNCVETNAMVFYSLTYSYKAFHQAHGRIDRLNTLFTQLYYYVLRSNSVIDKAVWGSLQQKKSFNESAWRAKFRKEQFDGTA